MKMGKIQKINLLLIEDNQVDVKIITRLLKKVESFGMDFSITNTTSIKDAESILADNGVDLILLDLNLPDSKDPIDCFKRISNKYADCPIVVLTGAEDLEVEKELLAQGLNDYLNKNEISSARLFRTILHVLERFKLEKKLKEQADKLKKYGDETYQKLLKAKEKAERASAIKGIFLANMSHEIRTPLHIILSMAGFLKKAELPKDEMKHVENIISSGDSLLRIVNDILDFSKIEAGEISLENIACNINEIVEKVKVFTEVLLAEKPVKLTMNIDNNVPEYVYGDPTRIHQILLNLVNNAAKFTEKGEITVAISCKQKNMNKATLLFEVTDTGIGIPKKKSDKIFEQFTQVDGSSTRKVGGTGLGLSISRSLVNLMNGNIGVNSTEGEGSTFWFEISLDITHQPRPQDDNSNKHDADFNKMARILVVEDSPMNQEIVQHTLKNLGCTSVTVVNNGKEAISAYKASDYQLIFMDCHMPEMDGFEATKQIRILENANEQHIPIVATTAKAIKGDREDCLNAGMDDYLSKPYSPEKFIEQLNKWL